MNTRKRLAFVLVLAMLACSAGFAGAEELLVGGSYKTGDVIPDFTVTLSDGQDVSLYGLLAEKKMVLLNFWATWCSPCRLEFPFMQEAYDEMSDDVGIISLSVFDPDTDEKINDYKAKLGLTSLPLGRDVGLQSMFSTEGLPLPTSIVIDRNGVICLIHVGAIITAPRFSNLFGMYAGDDYEGPLLLEEMPKPALYEAPGADKLSAAMNAEGGALYCVSMINGDDIHPFVPSGDGKSVEATNTDKSRAAANLTVRFEAEAGDVMAYEYLMDGRVFYDRLEVYLDGAPADLRTGSAGWTAAGIPVASSGEHEVSFEYIREGVIDEVSELKLRGARVVTGDEAAGFDIPAIPYVKQPLPGKETAIDVLTDTAREIVVLDKDGQIAENNAMYIAGDSKVTLRLRLGGELNPRFAALYTGEGCVLLSDMERDDKGYICVAELADYSRGFNAELWCSDIGDVDGANMILFASEEEAKAYIEYAMYYAVQQLSGEDLREFVAQSLAYADGDVICAFADYYDGAPLIAEETAAPEYVVTYIDEAGAPVAGVFTQLCDDGTCMASPSDENGSMSYTGNKYPYEVHVLLVPEGYEPVSEVFVFPEEGGEIVITLKKLPE